MIDPLLRRQRRVAGGHARAPLARALEGVRGSYGRVGDSPILFRYRAGDSLASLGGVFARTSLAWQRTAAGTFEGVAIGTLRDAHYFNGIRYALLEGSRTNFFIRSQELENAAWVKQNSTVTSDVAISPDGTMNADKLVENTGTGQHRMYQAVAKGASLIQYTGHVYAKAAERQFLYLRMTGGGETASANFIFDLVSGTVGVLNTTGSGGFSDAVAQMIPVGNGWYRCSITATSDATTQIFLIPGLSTSAVYQTGVSYTGDGVSGLLLWQMQLEAGPNASSPVRTISTTNTRTGDYLYFPIGFNVQELSLYMRFMEIGNVYLGGTGTLFHLGATSDADPKMRVRPSSSAGTGHTLVTLGAGVAITSSPAWGDTVEVMSQITSTPRTQLHQSVNQGAVVSSALGTPLGAANVLGANWSENRLAIGSTSGSIGSTGFFALHSLVVARGIRDIPFMRSQA